MGVLAAVNARLEAWIGQELRVDAGQDRVGPAVRVDPILGVDTRVHAGILPQLTPVTRMNASSGPLHHRRVGGDPSS